MPSLALNLIVTTTPSPCYPTTLAAHLQLSSKAATGSSQPGSHRGTVSSAHHCKSAFCFRVASSSATLPRSDNNGNFFNLFEELEENDNENDESEEVISST
ncbi:hypothetical protein SLEP1_g53759 [Rubroshorea leprosula]|uniref:Uncharacterized protein n=1 Tax=Rubroshorea leprosula TaxID=152421 RepID=A0AAV5MAA8_9ROSI|nr:hypothetical protein SLEP1_g53759 [Rubroshorea leprosula]